jgi:hypothetical protein
MSVIAKLLIRSISQFGTGELVELGCICENDLMAAYATTDEDKLFTKYSPWGEMKLNQPAGYSLGSVGDEFKQGDGFYVMALADKEAEDTTFPGSYAVCPATCASITDFGDGQAKRVEFRNSGPADDHRGVDRLNWKMSVDNPGATNQFKPGTNYWIALYPAAKFDRDATIRAAHGHV